MEAESAQLQPKGNRVSKVGGEAAATTSSSLLRGAGVNRFDGPETVELKIGPLERPQDRLQLPVLLDRHQVTGTKSVQNLELKLPGHPSRDETGGVAHHRLRPPALGFLHQTKDSGQHLEEVARGRHSANQAEKGSLPTGGRARSHGQSRWRTKTGLSRVTVHQCGRSGTRKLIPEPVGQGGLARVRHTDDADPARGIPAQDLPQHPMPGFSYPDVVPGRGGNPIMMTTLVIHRPYTAGPVSLNPPEGFARLLIGWYPPAVQRFRRIVQGIGVLGTFTEPADGRRVDWFREFPRPWSEALPGRTPIQARPGSLPIGRGPVEETMAARRTSDSVRVRISAHWRRSPRERRRDMKRRYRGE